MKVPTWILTTPTVQRLHHPIKITGGKRWQKVKSSKRWLIRPPQKWENIINQSSIINLKSSTLNHPSSILNHDFFFHIINVIRHVPGKPPIIESHRLITLFNSLPWCLSAPQPWPSHERSGSRPPEKTTERFVPNKNIQHNVEDVLY